MKVTKVLLNIMSVVSFVYGALYCFSLVFIPVGVYCFIAARRFSYKAEHLFDNYAVTDKTIKIIPPIYFFSQTGIIEPIASISLFETKKLTTPKLNIITASIIIARHK